MEIIKARTSDYVEVMYLLRTCIKDMNEKGMKQWNNAHPDSNLMKKHVEEGKVYLAKEKGVCRGMMVLTAEIPDDYRQVVNPDQNPGTLFLQWLAVHPIWQRNGIARLLLAFAEEYGRKHGFKNIKLDVFSGYDSANQIVRNSNFLEIGKFHSTFQRVPFICYEKKID